MLNEIKRKTLFLWLDCEQFHAVNAQKRGVDVANVFRKTPLILKVIRRLQVKFKLFNISVWLEAWRNNLSSYDTVIIHASLLTPMVVKYIRSKNKKIRIIVWYWNPIAKSEKIESFLPYDCEIWSFDESDTKVYDVNHNTQYYFNDITLKEETITNDVLFVGGDKGRLSFLKEIECKLIEHEVRTDFHIVSASNIENDTYKKRISYADILKKIECSKAILDVVSENQTGLTLRPLEALFLERKLITNDKRIIERDFYNPNNIFIIESDDLNTINNFINSPFEPVTEEILNKYDFDAWFARFFNCKKNK